MNSEFFQYPGLIGRPIEILLVEDNVGDVLLTRLALNRAKLANNVIVAQDGEQALLMLRRKEPFEEQPRPDLVLLDLNLPKLSGRDVLNEIKKDPALNEIPVVILSGSQAEVEVMRAHALYANAYIVKPVNFDHLKQIVSSIEAFWFSVVSLPGASGRVN